MSKKKALPDDVGDFFEGESIFFPPPPQPTQQTASPQNKSRQGKQAQSASTRSAITQTHTPQSEQDIPPAKESRPPREQESVVSKIDETMPPRNHDTVPPPMLEVVRKAVKRVGKEAATYRFTPEEKQRLADIVYTYGRQGYRTSENEITRIAVNWLLWDFEEHGAMSVLARLLKTLHE